LHDTDPDLAELVTQERISLDAAEGDAGRRKALAKQQREAEYSVVDTLKHWTPAFDSPKRVSQLVATLTQYGPHERPDLRHARRTAKSFAASLAQFIEEMPNA
jgi:ribosomal protein S4